MTDLKNHRRGFTLIEMALVLAIISLLVGAVVGGSILLRQSEIDTALNDFGKYTAAVKSFKMQYGSMPGDLLDATDYWTSAGGSGLATDNNCSDNVTASSTCNGDGNGQIGGSVEPYLAWQQLVLAGFINGSYSGKSNSWEGAVPGTNVPKSRVKGGDWSFAYKDTTSDTDNYDQALGNYLAFGNIVYGTDITRAPAISPGDAKQIDTKTDDGKPGTGRVIAMKPTFALTPDCAAANGAGDDDDTYKISYLSVACGLNMSLTLK